MHRIEADLLIPGRGSAVHDGVVILDGAKISYAGAASQAPDAAEADRVRVPVVMPGLWDCHAHFIGITSADLNEVARTPVPLSALRAARDARAALDAGFTSVREAGGVGIHLARAIDEGTLPGPTIYSPGAVLSPTGGHGDLHSFPVEWVRDYGARGGLLRLCDGVPACLEAVRSQLRLGARVIKVCASGGVISEVDDPMHQQFSHDELRAMVEEAGRAERIVMAHCHGRAGIVAALEAGCRTIEHGSCLDEETAAMMLESEAVLVPTRFIVERLLAGGHQTGLPEGSHRKLSALADQHARAMALAYEAGVRIAMGTDIFSSPGGAVPWGANAHELLHLVAAGMTPLEAIEAATANAPLTLGPQAPRSGLLAEGYDADVIAVTANPLNDLSVLTDPDNVIAVWKAGSLEKGLIA